ncbi:type II toxin-antitoxin system RelE/ParE family toxin [Spirosoma profusum]|uniref:type II toxin-antitoxin system RelE/ParE family toxin n=1 Tax=Spirosoma profusum TaxID=2771354 RepID=UPI001CC232FB|nr:type II toxin-antitoxin system RelE/ParE family toxin [Spirosoma profusum]
MKKKYRSFKTDFSELLDSLEVSPQQGEPLGKDGYKVRLAIKTKQKGKSGGARVITCVKIVNEQVFIVAVYDKSEYATLTDKKIEQRLKNAGL